MGYLSQPNSRRTHDAGTEIHATNRDKHASSIIKRVVWLVVLISRTAIKHIQNSSCDLAAHSHRCRSQCELWTNGTSIANYQDAQALCQDLSCSGRDKRIMIGSDDVKWRDTNKAELNADLCGSMKSFPHFPWKTTSNSNDALNRSHWNGMPDSFQIRRIQRDLCFWMKIIIIWLLFGCQNSAENVENERNKRSSVPSATHNYTF